MPHMLIMQEYDGFGIPVWRFASSSNEIPKVYAPLSLGNRELESWQKLDKEKISVWIRTLAKPWIFLDFGQYDSDDDYALYTPKSEEDFHWLCCATAAWGGCIEIITPSELSESKVSAITPIWSTARRLHYLLETDLCHALEVPWVYLLGIYNYEPCLSAFIAESRTMIDAVIEYSKGLEDCFIIPLEEALETEQKNYNDIYRQFEEDLPPSEETKAALEELKEFREEFERRFGKIEDHDQK